MATGGNQRQWAWPAPTPGGAVPPSIAIVLGTRPEALKLAPVVDALCARGVRPLLISTGQHRDLLDRATADAGLMPDIDLGLMRPGQGTGALLADAAHGLLTLFRCQRPAMVIVQGDTASAYAGALAAARIDCPITHVEAGLRTGRLDDPWPEELFRRAITALTSLHCAPTPLAARTLVREGVAPSAVHVTGNSAIDRLMKARAAAATANGAANGTGRDAGQELMTRFGGRFALATIHRRENHGRIDALADALHRVGRHHCLPVLVPIHPSPAMERLRALLRGSDMVHPLPPLDHGTMVTLLSRAVLVLTDSGGLQEEAVTLGTPLVILRDVTERAEAVRAGRARLAGADPAAILDASSSALVAGRFAPCTLFGDGRAGLRIASLVLGWLD